MKEREKLKNPRIHGRRKDAPVRKTGNTALVNSVLELNNLVNAYNSYAAFTRLFHDILCESAF